MRVHNISQFPWDLTVPEDVAELQKAATEHAARLERLQGTLEKMRAHGLDVRYQPRYHNLPEVSEASIADPALRAEYVRHLNDFLLAESVDGGAIAHRLWERTPKLVAKLLPTVVDPRTDPRNNSYPSTETLQRWNTRGYRALTAEEQGHLQVLRKSLFERDHTNLPRLLREAGPQSRAWYLARLAKPEPQDSLKVLLDQLRNEEDLAQLRLRPDFGETKRRLRERMEDNPSDNMAYEFKHYPWDPKNADDMALLYRLRAGALADGDYEAFRRDALELAHRIEVSEGRKIVSHQRSDSRISNGHPTYAVLALDPDTIRDRKLRDEFQRLLARHRKLVGFHEGAQRLLEQEPAAFLATFPDVQPQFHDFHSFAGDAERVNEMEDGSWKVSAGKTPLGELFTNMANLLREGKPFGPNEAGLFAYYVRLGKGDVTALGLASPLAEQRELALSALRKSPAATARFLRNEDGLSIFGGKSYANARAAIIDALGKDPQWREATRKAFFSETRASHQYDDFPWDLRNPQDLAYLQHVIARRAAVRESFLAILGRMRDAGFLDWSPRNGLSPSSMPLIDDASITDPKLRAEYLHTLSEYVISTGHGLPAPPNAHPERLLPVGRLTPVNPALLATDAAGTQALLESPLPFDRFLGLHSARRLTDRSAVEGAMAKLVGDSDATVRELARETLRPSDTPPVEGCSHTLGTF